MLRKQAIADASYKAMFRIWRRWQLFAFLHWRDHVRLGQENKLKAVRFQVRMLKWAMARAFTRWLSMTRQVKYLPDLLARVPSKQYVGRE